MPPTVIDVRAAEDIRDVVHKAAEAISHKRLVAFPTETVYGIAAKAIDAEAVERLRAAKGRKEGHPITLAIRNAEEARDYVPELSLLAQRLARRCWPGPVTLVLDSSHSGSLARQLPPSVQQAVAPAGTVGLRVPGHEIILDVLRMIPGPLALTSANLTGEPEARTAQEVISALGDKVDLVLDDGPSRFGQASTVVRVIEERYEILRVGVVPERTLKRLASLMVLFVCTGNTCRSPMAEAMARGMAAQRLACGVEEVEDRGVVVASAGVAAMSGGRASEHTVEVMSSMGFDVGQHETQPLTEPLVRYADLIYTMTQSHRQAIAAQWPAAADRVKVLCVDGSDITDPVGGPLERYQRCARQISEELAKRLDEWPFPAQNTSG